jgi:hypothetical protein
MFRGGQSVPAGDIEHVTRLVERAGVADTVALRLSAAVVLTAVAAVGPDQARAMRVADHALELLGQSPWQQQAAGTALSAIVLASRATALMVDQGGNEAAEALKAAVAAAHAAGCGRLKRQCLGTPAVVEARLRGGAWEPAESPTAEALPTTAGCPWTASRRVPRVGLGEL